MTGSEYWIGIMSGTSLDGVDAVLCSFESSYIVHTSIHNEIPDQLYHELLHLQKSGADEIHRSEIATQKLMGLYAQTIDTLIKKAELSYQDIRAVGVHGQTIRHCPDQKYTYQLMNGALLAELCQIDIVANFRERDIAAHGQGAPLAPCFHAEIIKQQKNPCAILNLGGIANISYVSKENHIIGFDCGPANVLMDLWARQHLNCSMDINGTWAASGNVIYPLLEQLLEEPFFQSIPPKSTGRDLFNQQWLNKALRGHDFASQDIQATLLELTVQSIKQDIKKYTQAQCIYVCGGGALNQYLMKRISESFALEGIEVHTTTQLGIQPMDMEALIFAWLAHQCIYGKTINYSTVTGALGPRILGAIYQK
jgi:anhydro-N-acetylmuramic acid kinase